MRKKPPISKLDCQSAQAFLTKVKPRTKTPLTMADLVDKHCGTVKKPSVDNSIRVVVKNTGIWPSDGNDF